MKVLVIGGGSAGLAAAVAASRAGAHAVLIDRHGMLGGMGTAALVHTFCGLYLMDGDEPVIANPGIASEIADRMIAATGSPPVKMGRLWVLPQRPVEFARIADEMVREAGVEVMHHCELTELEPGWRARAVCRGMALAIDVDAVVDASGDAVGAALLDVADDRTEGVRLQRPAYICGIQGVDGELSNLAIAGRVVEGVRGGHLPQGALGMHFRRGCAGEIYGTLDLSGDEKGAYDPTDPACLSALEASGRRIAGAVVAWLRGQQPGWEKAGVSQWPARAGVRESRVWPGRARLTGADVLSGRRHEDDVALATWPLELRETHRGPKLRYPDGGRPAGIPAGALQAAGFDRLYVAGRCVSCDHEAQASVRVMGTCFATGEAAGRMAAGAEPIARSC